MLRTRQIIVLGILLGGAAACWIVQHLGRVELDEREEVTKQRVEQLALLEAENQALSNQLTHINGTEKLSRGEMSELSRLHGEVGLLRQALREIDRLRDTNGRYLAELAHSELVEGGEFSIDGQESSPNYWARERFAFAGFTEPEAALKTTLWIWVDANLDDLLTHCTPEQRTELEQIWTDQTESAMAALRQRMAALYSLDRGGVRLVQKKLTSPDEALLDLYFEGDGKRRRFSLQKLGEQWTVTGIVAIYN